MRNPVNWAAAAIMTGTVLRVVFLGAKSLWFDEASTLLLASQTLAKLPPMLTSNEVNPPLYYALMHFWLKAFSDPRLGLRLFAALCGIGSLFALRALAGKLTPERARLPALWFAAFSSFWIHVAQDGRAYALLLLVSLLSTLVTVELSEEKPRPFYFPVYAALAALGLYTHYYYAILLAGHVVWLGRKTKNPLGVLLMHAAAALAFAPWLPRFASQLRMHVSDAVVGEALTLPRALDLLGTTFFDITFLGLVLPAWTGVVIGAGFIALTIAAVVDARHAPVKSAEWRGVDFCLTHLVTALLLVAAVELWSGRPVTQARYFIPISPVLLLLAALGVRRAWMRITTGVVVAAGCAGYFFSAIMVDPRLDVMAAVIRRSSKESVPIVHLGKYYYLPLRIYYLPERRHLLVAEKAVDMDYRGMPPYPGVIEDKDLPGLGPCIVVDEGRTLSAERISLATGAQIAALRR